MSDVVTVDAVKTTKVDCIKSCVMAHHSSVDKPDKSGAPKRDWGGVVVRGVCGRLF